MCADHYESNTKFASYGNWLLPGHLMVGRYPFVEPSRCTSRELGVEQLQQILEAGITTFVSLQVRGARWAHGGCCLRIQGTCCFKRWLGAVQAGARVRVGSTPVQSINGWHRAVNTT